MNLTMNEPSPFSRWELVIGQSSFGESGTTVNISSSTLLEYGDYLFVSRDSVRGDIPTGGVTCPVCPVTFNYIVEFHLHLSRCVEYIAG
jgi:hypothetical protein